MKALIITYNFPPEVIGVRRILKWIEYFPENNIQPLVLTVKNVHSPHYDSAPLELLEKQDIPVFRTGSLDPYRLMYIIKRKSSASHEGQLQNSTVKNTSGKKNIMQILRKWIFIPDDRIAWVPFAVLKGMQIIKTHKPDIIISTSFPHSAHIAGLLLKKICKIPWIADFRDGWSQNPTFFSYGTKLHEEISARLEKNVVKSADAVITVSPPITDYLKKLCSSSPGKFHTIYNGYDPEDFPIDKKSEDIEQNKSVISDIKSEETSGQIAGGKNIFQIIYTGTIFGNRSPLNFFKALKELLSQNQIPEKSVRAVLYTSMPDEFADYLEKSGMKSVIQTYNFLPYRECLEMQRKAGALLLFLPKEKNTGIMVTQKVFEYLGAERPILAIIPEGACKEVLKKTGGAVFADPENLNEIKTAILGLYNSWKNKNEIHADKFILNDFTRQNQTKFLSEIIRKIASPHEPKR